MAPAFVLLVLAACRTPLPALDDDGAGDGGPRNACGGTMPLAGAPQTTCAPCSRWTCSGADAVICTPFATVNACGGCGATPAEECNGRDDNCDGCVDEGCVRRLTVLRLAAAHPRLGGDRVALDARGLSSNASDAVVATIPDGAARFLSPHSDPPGLRSDPSQESETTIDGTWVAWVTRRVDPLWDGGRIVAFDLATATTLATIDVAHARHPSIDAGAGRIVFEAPFTSTDADLWEWTAATRVARPLTGREGDEHEPELSGRRLVFTRGTGTSPLFNRQIVVRELDTGREQVLSAGLEGFHTEPAIDGDRVVWRQEIGSTAPSRTGRIWLYDLGTGERRRLGTTEVAYAPRIGGTLVCWSTLSGQPGGLTVLDLDTGRERVLSRDGHHCDVEGRRLVWLEGGSTVDVYWRDLLDGEP